MRTQNAPLIRLTDYQPAPYNIDTVELDVELDGKTTLVRSTLGVVRAMGTPVDAALFLDGDELSLTGLKINGDVAPPSSFRVSADGLTITGPPEANNFKLEITTQIAPDDNTKLMGLYRSNGVYCTQCEAEGFRRITYFLDRPDILSVYTVRLSAPATACRHLLSNGNLVEEGEADGRRFAVWHDPHPKPCYLFAMVGGNLDVLSDAFTTGEGREVTLNIYVETGKAEQARYAMDALKRSMKWDEEAYGRFYDLDVFNIVAVSDFNMGAMENKGLNVFNDKYVLADPNLATDADFENIEAIIAHEYFHNWTGNRITCRDWFQLCLKEGLTVFRDQQFSADQRSEPVQRIKQVRQLKAAQFSEDAGPLAHSVRPQAYREINNFYTATVYQKGAELVRMIHTLLGPDLYREGTDLYFERHDGEAAVVEDFLRAFEDASGQDLAQFARWYAQAGTPVVRVERSFGEAEGVLTLDISQQTPTTPGDNDKKPVVIPIRIGLIDKGGDDLPLHSDHPALQGDVLELNGAKTRIRFSGLSSNPSLSLLRGFSAPVQLDFNETPAERRLRARHDSDPYKRWEAFNGLTLASLVSQARDHRVEPSEEIAELALTIAGDETLDPAFRAAVLSLPSAHEVAREIGKDIDPTVICTARNGLLADVGAALLSAGGNRIANLRNRLTDANSLEASGIRALANTLLALMCAASDEGTLDMARSLFQEADNMTDRMAGLSILIAWDKQGDRMEGALDHFIDTFGDNSLVVDKWFGAQAMRPGGDGLQRMEQLLLHPAFTLNNPNRARSLLGPFAAGNLDGFHRADGAGYTLYLEQIAKLDAINPQVSARLLTLMDLSLKMEPDRRAKAVLALQELAKKRNLSRDSREILDRTLTAL